MCALNSIYVSIKVLYQWGSNFFISIFSDSRASINRDGIEFDSNITSGVFRNQAPVNNPASFNDFYFGITIFQR